jgi:Ca2+-binding EF-hand superfamily protein
MGSWEVSRLKEIDKLLQKQHLSLATLFDSYDTNSSGVLDPHAFRSLVQALGTDTEVDLRPDDAQRLHEHICGSPSASMTRGDLESALARVRQSSTYGDANMSYTGGADYMDDYWDSRDSTLAGRPGFRPDLAPSSVITALTNYVPRMRDLLHSIDTRRSGTVTLHDFRRVLRRLGLQLEEADVDTFMLALDTTGRDSLFAYEPMLRWLSKRNQRLTNPALIAVLKRLAGPRVYPRLHQVLQQKIYRAGNYAGSDEISLDDLRDICVRLDVPMSQRELTLLAENYGGGRLLRVNALLAGISQVMRKDETLRKRWASSIMKRIVANLKQSGLSIRDSFYAYCRGDSMSMSDFRRFVENQGLRLTREEVDDLIRGTKATQKSAMISYFDFRGIFAAAEKTHEGWGALGVHLKQKLLQQREFLLDTMRAADTGGSGTVNRSQLRRVCSSHILSLSPSEIEQCISAAPTLNDGGSAGRTDYAELLRGLGNVKPSAVPNMGISNRALPGGAGGVVPNYDTSMPVSGASSAAGMAPYPSSNIGGAAGVTPSAMAMAEAASASASPMAGMPGNVLGVPMGGSGASAVPGGAFPTAGVGVGMGVAGAGGGQMSSVASMATGAAAGGTAGDVFGRAPIPPERQRQWQAGIESQLYHGSTTLNWMGEQAKDDLTAGETQWAGQSGSAVRTPAFSAWMTQMKVQLTQFVTHYDKVVQEIHERLGIFTVPTSVVDRLGMKAKDLNNYKKPSAATAATKKQPYKPGTAGKEFKQTAKATADMRIQELEVQLKDVRDHYIKKVRELHRKLEHYEYGGGGARDIALRDMEGVISHRDNAVMQQSRRAMHLQQQLTDALGASHHAMWQAENHLTLTHADSSPSELMASSNVWEQNMRWLVRTLDTMVNSQQMTGVGSAGGAGTSRCAAACCAWASRCLWR